MSSLLRMNDGVDATYSKGSFLVRHRGVPYVNCDPLTNQPIVFADDVVGGLIVPGQIEVEGPFKRKYILPEAKTLVVKMENGVDASYLEGGFELVHGENTYLLMDDRPIFSSTGRKTSSSPSELRGYLKGSKLLQIPFTVGLRGIGVHTFEKKSTDSSKKRKRSDANSEKKYEAAKKRTGILQKNAPDVLKKAKQVLRSVRELITMENAARLEMNTGSCMFEDPVHPLKDALDAVSSIVCSAKGEKFTFGTEVSDVDD